MNTSETILYIVWALAILSLLFIPVQRRREASICILFQQFVTWFLGLLVVEMNLIAYPVRLFADVNQTSFTFEFIIYPTMGVFYILLYPVGKQMYYRIFYTISFVTAITISEILLEKYTNTIEYIHWNWLYSWISLGLTLLLLKVFYNWYFQVKEMYRKRTTHSL